MNNTVRFFPFMPKPKETGTLIGAIFFYILVFCISTTIWFFGSIICLILAFIIGWILGLTIVLAFLAPIVGFILGLLPGIVGFAGFGYALMGTIFAIMSYNGHEFN